MSVAEYVRAARHPLEWIYDGLLDSAHCERVMALLLGGYAAAWTLYGVVAKGSQDLHFDMGEMYAWSREITFGTPKHPPLGAWLVRIWFSVFPLQVWAYYLLAVILATAALWIAWRLAARYLPQDKRAVGILLLTLVPFYNFHALKYNANTVEIPFWAATTWFFLRSYETRRASWAALAGLAAAGATLGKYWSIFLLAGLAVAALTDRRRGPYFRSLAPWVTIAVGALALVPHFVWLTAHDYAPFRYALNEHAAAPLMAAESAVAFPTGFFAYIVAPIVLTLIAAHPDLDAIRDTLWPAGDNRRIIVVAFIAPLLLAVAAAIVSRNEIVSLWAMSAATLLPIALLSSPMVKLSRAAGIRILGIAMAFPLLMVALSPGIALVIHREGVPNYASHYRLIARAVELAWRERTMAPLRIVGSDTNVVNGIIFYMRSAPLTLNITNPARTPWASSDLIKLEGVAMVCAAERSACLEAMIGYESRYPGAKSEEVTLARSYMGTHDQPENYRIVTIPPHGGGPARPGS